MPKTYLIIGGITCLICLPGLIRIGMGCQREHITGWETKALLECEVQKQTVNAQIQAIFDITKEDMCQ